MDGSFSLAYLVFNTIMNLTTQEAQVACFRNAAAHLEPGGCFVIKVMIPELQRLPPGETFRVFRGSETYWGIDEYDVANQGLISHHIEIADGRRRARLDAVPLRLACRVRPDGAARRDEVASAGAGGGGSRSRARATSTSRSGRSEEDAERQPGA